MAHVLEQLRNVEQEMTKLCLPTSNGYIFIFPKEIIYCQSFNAYTYIFSTTEEKIFIGKSLKEMESLLSPDRFYRIHKSYVVNLNRIKRYQRNGNDKLVMENEDCLPISRMKKKGLLDKLLNKK